MRTSFVFVFVFAIAACAPVSQGRSARAFDEPMLGVSSRSPPSSRTTKLLVTTEPTCPVGHSCDIVAIVDVHTEATSEQKGFDELRAMAMAKQADAVVGAEFEHGGKDEPSHLSGVIVRYGRPVPPHVELGEIEIPSDGTDQDKGLAQMMAKAYAMGGDQVIDVTFEHGEEGAQGVLKGRVIRYR